MGKSPPHKGGQKPLDLKQWFPAINSAIAMASQRLTQNLTLRRAIAADSDWVVPLLFATGPALFSYVFAATPAQAQETLAKAFITPHHAFSYEHTQILEVEGQPAGMFVGYPSHVKQQADEKVHMVMARIISLRRLPKILVNIADFSRIKQDVDSDAYYILGFGLLPDFHAAGLDVYLLAQAEAEAQRWQCETICTDVPFVNTSRRQLLEANGYQVTCSKTTERFHQFTRAGGIHRLTKFLAL